MFIVKTTAASDTTSPAPDMSNPRKQMMVGMSALAAIGGFMYAKRWEVEGVAIPMFRNGLLVPSPSFEVNPPEKEDLQKKKKNYPLKNEDPLKKDDEGSLHEERRPPEEH